MIRRLVGVVVTDEAVIAPADRLRCPVLGVISAFSENDAVKTKRRAEEKRNPEGEAPRGKRGKGSCAAPAGVDYCRFHEAPELYADLRMNVYANQLVAPTTETISCRSSSSDITFRKPPLASPIVLTHWLIMWGQYGLVRSLI